VKTLLYIFAFLCWPVFGHSQFKEDSIKVHTLLSKGGQAARTAQFDSSRYYYREAEKLSREMDYQHGIMSSTLGHGMVHHYENQTNEALEYYLEALEMLNGDIDPAHPDVELLYNSLGGAYIDLGYHIKAREYLEKTLELKQANRALAHHKLGLIYQHFGENQSALHHFMTAYPSYLEQYGEDGAQVAQLYTNIGNIHHNLGNIEQAQQYFQRGIAIYEESRGPDYWNIAYPYHKLGSLYHQTGKRSEALQYYLKSLDLCRKNHQELILLEAQNEGALARYYLEQGNYELSRNHAEKAIAILQEAHYAGHPGISEFHTIIGQAHVKQGNNELASQWFDKARDLTIKGYGEIHPQIAGLYLEQSKIYYEMKDFPAALQTAQLGLIATSANFTSSDPAVNPGVADVLHEKLLINILKHKGDVYQGLARKQNRLENLTSAMKQYREAVSVIDYFRRGYLSESAKLFLRDHAHKVYQQGIEVCYLLFNLKRSDEYLEQAFFFMEKSRSSMLSEALQATTVTEIKGVDPGLLEKEAELDQQVKSLELKLADARIDQTDSIQVNLKKDLSHAKSRVDSLEGVCRTSYPYYHQLKYDLEVLEFEQALDQVPGRTLVLSFFEADSNWYVLSFGEQTAFKRISKSDLPVEIVNRFRENISNPETDPGQVLTDGQLIYEKLLRETIQQHPKTDRLIVVPDGTLNYLPFEALASAVDQQTRRARYLIEDYVVSYRNSLTLRAKLENSRGSYDQVYVGFAPSYDSSAAGQLALKESLSPLKGAKAEVERVGSMFKGKQYLDQQATEHEFKHGQASASILHLVMHALIDDEDPMKSRLLFSQQSDSLEDGYLNAYEIYQLQLEAELAVLSACNTGRGKINKGEGVMSLSRAFMYAGCPNIVLSLWQVPGQASGQIMYSFFENLKKGLPKDASLREAKLKFLSTANPKQSHPAYWASFVLVGDDQPLSRPGSPWLWIGLGGLFVVLAGLYLQKRKKRKAAQQQQHTVLSIQVVRSSN